MGTVFEIGISTHPGKEMQKVESIEVVAGKGLLNDRYFKDNNNNVCQITLIESENIEHYNRLSGTSLSYLSFRRNIVTKGIKLNPLVGKKFLIGKVLLKGHALCEPCLTLQKKLKQENFVKNLLHKGGLRCEIIKSGKIFIKDIIKL